MKAASLPVQRPAQAKLLIVDDRGNIRHWARSKFVDLLHPGDLIVANDAAVMPASLTGQHLPSGRTIEVRLVGRRSIAPDAVREFSAVVFGAGDFRTRTEDRPLPPPFAVGDRLALGPLRAVVTELLSHPRLVRLEFDGSPADIWEGLARHGHPIQYSHVQKPLALWDVWTPIAGPPVAFESPSAGFALDWSVLNSMSARGVKFATITHAAGISSTGDQDLDALLPFDEPYQIPERTARAINKTKAGGGRIIAIGTTVVRALEDAAEFGGSVRVGEGLATHRIGVVSHLRVVSAILSGTHEPGTSHYDLLRAFIDDRTLDRVDQELNAHEYRTHEFGDSVFIEQRACAARYASVVGRKIHSRRTDSLIAGSALPDVNAR
jgi:S-adenosylmethionine:tRNA ribosyltransferase-isomerase